MDSELRSWIDRHFAVPRGGRSKVMALADAVTDNVRPGDAIHLGVTHSRGSAAFWELIRRFRGTDPRFTLLAVQMTSPEAPLVHAGLASKIVTSWSGDSYPSPGANGVYQRAWMSGGVEFEHWSILTFVQRLAAGARGHPWAITRSLAGSSMEKDNNVQVMEDGTAMIPALVPDVSIFHAPAADDQGNVLFSPPLMENVWGALAARRGCIVTVDKIVDASYVRAHAHMTRIPASAVRAVVEAPLGAHPGGLLPTGLEGIMAYGEDYEFWADIKKASRDPSTMDTWMRKWVLETGSHEAYVKRLGHERVTRLRRRSDPAAYRGELEESLVTSSIDRAPNAIEWAIIAAARELRARVRANGYTAMLAGAGLANLAAWVAAYALADEQIPIDLVAEMGLVGYWPRPGEPILFNQRNFPTCTMLTDIDTSLSVVMGGAGARSIGALGAAQVDRTGNINSTQIPGETLLMGSGGANDVVSSATESIVIVSQNKDRFVEQVPYVTGPGDRVTAVISTIGVYHKINGELVLVGVFGDEPIKAARECVARCGWKLQVARQLEVIERPSREELRMVRVMDPKAWFRG
jgi:acyl CoA:acetate/3-ketoacid CoA transferase alpha subunit/acyl CoA:acetate/3-ketoacid CoA transferase beta subunit